MQKIRHIKPLNRKIRILNITGSNCRTACKATGLPACYRGFSLLVPNSKGNSFPEGKKAGEIESSRQKTGVL
ncbi:hypothetical protein MSLAZ_2480 [Methanosarcina lacustris Z-7289]|uniref:Uncharacterized protein n=1 Tax=Methanosarcina lacustris Z-7289 TaxID=1434111 RepID=A0A0E3S5S2_9EURY|nr:hypothetical protein MSLAZ_2480 [Methanosarcina lacustris Z-7289]